MKKLLLSVMACYALTASAQVQENQNFLYLYSDSIVYAKKIQLRPDFAGYWQLRVDSRRVPVDQVKFFNNQDGFFANTRKFSLLGETAFSERIVAGKINLFQERSYDPYAYHSGHGYGENRYSRASLSMYYNKGFGDLKKVKYKNLAEDMADHPESMKFLNAYKKSANLSKIMYTAAGASIIGSFATLLSGGTSSMKSPNMAVTSILMGVGVGFAVGGFAVQVSGTRNIENAIDSYNR
ncbi:hypothetical protein [Pedobacter gandavensis]|uniref:Uncharacterized protein n=1 Tax=Pedobacter gandavensis TaxID=2679963 RepID=A0ABR6F1E9_9SPHI|nr:hypothetical protein [Pedobacter gandavensis]MBB2151353.1 hypothetical protein [Pedobacter gandavensis]